MLLLDERCERAPAVAWRMRDYGIRTAVALRVVALWPEIDLTTIVVLAAGLHEENGHKGS